MGNVIDGPMQPDEARAMFYGWRIVSVAFLTFIGAYVLAIALLLLLRLPKVEPGGGRAGFE